MIRPAAVAGTFYPQDADQLIALIDPLLQTEQAPQPAFGLIAPHAGYVYSGAVAASLFAQTRIPARVIILGPNHQGLGAPLSLSAADGWQTPLGTVPVATDLRLALQKLLTGLQLDNAAHQREHSIEVMLPLLQRCQPDLQILPLSLARLSLQNCLALAQGLAQLVKQSAEEVLLLASSDMNHFAAAEENMRLDQLAIDAMTAYDPAALYQVVRENNISMCGMCAAVTVMQAARLLGATQCRLVGYSHSGRVNGDNSRVVGYAGLRLR